MRAKGNLAQESQCLARWKSSIVLVPPDYSAVFLEHTQIPEFRNAISIPVFHDIALLSKQKGMDKLSQKTPRAGPGGAEWHAEPPIP